MSLCAPDPLSVHGSETSANTHTRCFLLQQVDQVDRVEEVDMARFIQQLESHIAAEVGDQLTLTTKAASGWRTYRLNLCVRLQTRSLKRRRRFECLLKSSC